MISLSILICISVLEIKIFSNQIFLIMFWIHFISINLFTGGWIVKDSQNLVLTNYL